MQATDDDRIPNTPAKKGTKLWIVVIMIALAGLATYFFYPEEQAPQKIPKPAQSLAIKDDAPLPTIPKVEVTVAEEPDFILPPLDESDSVFRTQLIEMSSELAPWLQMEELIRRSVTFNDGLSRGKILSKLVSLPPPEGKFIATKTDEGVFLTTENYTRYSAFNKILTTIDTEKLVQIFHLFRPLLQQAYGELGYKPDDFGASIVFSMNEILATPVIEEPIALETTNFQYRFADPELENRSPLQKQLIRMGPETTLLIQEKINRLKSELKPSTN